MSGLHSVILLYKILTVWPTFSLTVIRKLKHSDENSKVSGGSVVSSVQFETEDYNV
jgi:hypothetical protein